MVYHITEQIPTVMAIGAVSRTAEAAMGKGKRRKATVKSRKSGSKAYKAANWHMTKSFAEKDAAFFRKAGHSVKVVKEYNKRMKKWGYMVYVK